MIDSFVNELGKVELINVFNPYRDRCVAYDHSESSVIRKENLSRLLRASVKARVETIWFGRDLGYLGGRRTGIALTDELHLEAHSSMIPGLNLEKATLGPAKPERTANMTWEVLEALQQPIFLWNIFPFHPHETERPFSNRCHTRSERMRIVGFTKQLLKILQPRKIIAVGNDAAQGLREIEVDHIKVRHPSYGGKADFVSGLEREYSRSLQQLNQPKLI